MAKIEGIHNKRGIFIVIIHNMAAVKDIEIYGAGGFGREVACLINRINELEPTWNLVGFFDDDASLKGKQISHYGPYLGGMDELNKWENPLAVVVAVGSPKAVRCGDNF